MKYEKLLTVILFLLALSLIVFLTFQNSGKSGELSNGITDRILHFLWESGLMKYDFIRNSDFGYVLVRKIGHIAEYFLLGMTAMLLFRKFPKALLKAVLLCAAISLLDQSVKSFLPGREFDPTDFPYDFAGYASGAFIASFFGKKRNNDRK